MTRLKDKTLKQFYKAKNRNNNVLILFSRRYFLGSFREISLVQIKLLIISKVDYNNDFKENFLQIIVLWSYLYRIRKKYIVSIIVIVNIFFQPLQIVFFKFFIQLYAVPEFFIYKFVVIFTFFCIFHMKISGCCSCGPSRAQLHILIALLNSQIVVAVEVNMHLTRILLSQLQKLWWFLNVVQSQHLLEDFVGGRESLLIFSFQKLFLAVFVLQILTVEF